MDAIVDLRNIQTSYGDFVALHDISLSLQAGEILGLIGPSNSGKSTILKVIAGLQPISGGTVQVDGFDMSHPSPQARKKISIRYQKESMGDANTIREYIAKIAREKGVGENDFQLRIHELSHIFANEKDLDTNKENVTDELFEIATLVAADIDYPKILLIDEPAKITSPRVRESFEVITKDVLSRGGVIVFATTRDWFAVENATTIAVVNDGALLGIKKIV